MKELSFEKMERMDAGVSCFYSIPIWLLTRGPVYGGLSLWSDAFDAYCRTT